MADGPALEVRQSQFSDLSDAAICTLNMKDGVERDEAGLDPRLTQYAAEAKARGLSPLRCNEVLGSITNTFVPGAAYGNVRICLLARSNTSGPPRWTSHNALLAYVQIAKKRGLTPRACDAIVLGGRSRPS